MINEILDEILFHIGVEMMCSGTDRDKLIIHLDLKLYQLIKKYSQKITTITIKDDEVATLFGIKIQIDEPKGNKLYWRLEKILSQGTYCMGDINNE